MFTYRVPVISDALIFPRMLEIDHPPVIDQSDFDCRSGRLNRLSWRDRFCCSDRSVGAGDRAYQEASPDAGYRMSAVSFKANITGRPISRGSTPVPAT